MKRLYITVSGGRTSAYMAIKLFKKYKYLYDMRFVFANTGLEHEETLKFINNIQKHFKLPIIWIEAKVNHGVRKSSDYKFVNFNTASRKGEPFEEVIKKYGLPNQNYLHCTRELKIMPMDSLMVDLGCDEKAIGIRADELRRYKPKKGVIYPLIELFSTDKEDILEWWSKQPFDLTIPEHLGNCTSCFKKSDKKLDLILKEEPKVFKFFKKMEVKYPDPSRNIYRGQRTTVDLLNGVKSNIKNKDVCAEECGTVEV